MTTREFARRRYWGQVPSGARVRTVVWRFRVGEWQEEIFTDGRYLTIEEQEAAFRFQLSAAEFQTAHFSQYGGESYTVQACNWKAGAA